MSRTPDQDRAALMLTFRSSLIMLSFGTVLLALLIAIDRPHWFTLRPVSGTAAAMSQASSARSDTRATSIDTTLGTQSQTAETS